MDQLCTRAIKWANLKRLSKAEKKLAITVFSFPPDKGNVGTAAYLNVFSSIYSVLKELKADGYNVEGLPESSEALIEEVIHDKEARFSSPDLNIAYKMPTREYYQLTPYAKALEESWGKAPGTLNSDGQNLIVYGKQFGNIFIGVQPTFGYEGDPMRLLFSKSASPHHGFAAYYTFLEKIFQADAVLHFGTHGSLEFMPGKQVIFQLFCCTFSKVFGCEFSVISSGLVRSWKLVFLCVHLPLVICIVSGLVSYLVFARIFHRWV